MTNVLPEHEIPTWLIAASDQRAAKIGQTLGDMPEHMMELAAGMVIESFLTEPTAETDEELERWNRSCDNCGKLCGESEMATATITRLIQDRFRVSLTVGACRSCWDAA